MVVPGDGGVLTQYILPIMGFWGALLGGITGLAGLFKKPAVQQGAGVLGGILGGGAKGSQDARLAQDLANARIYDSAMQGALGQGNLDLNQRKFSLEAGGKRAADVGRASLMQNVGDFSMGGPGNWKATGGIRPSSFGPEAKEAARLLMARQLAGLQGPEQFAAIKYPEVPQASKAGIMEKLMGGLGLGGTILGGIGGLMGKGPNSTVPGVAPGSPYDPYGSV